MVRRWGVSKNEERHFSPLTCSRGSRRTLCIAAVPERPCVLESGRSCPGQAAAEVLLSAPTVEPSELKLLGFRLHPMTAEEVIAQIGAAVTDRRRLVMANLNVHGMAMMYESAGMARLLFQPDCQVMIDGMPVLFLANLLNRAGLGREKRTTSLDFYDDLFARGRANGWQFAYIGSRPEVLESGIEILRERFPDLKIEGRDGYFDFRDFTPGSRNMDIVDWLRDLSPDVVIVGMGMPRQEEWIEYVQHQIDARVFLPTGAYLDYQVGVQATPPRWLGRYGLEWAYRFMRSPYRLGFRYFIEPVILTWRILKHRPLANGQSLSKGTRGSEQTWLSL